MSKGTVLIVDDELVVRRLLGDALRRAGYTIELVSGGAEALERLARPGIDLLLLDLRLGDIEGVQVMQGARQIWPNLPIIMLTANGSLSSAIAAVRCGAADYMLKPIDAEALRERVGAVLAHHRRSQTRTEQLRSMYTQFQSMLYSEGILREPIAPTPAGPTTCRGVYESGPLRIDVHRHIVTMSGLPVDVTPSEFAILLELLTWPGSVVPCLRLARAIQTVADDEEAARQLIRPHIVRLRRKLEHNPQQPHHLMSVRSMGYRWVGDPSSVPAASDYAFA